MPLIILLLILLPTIAFGADPVKYKPLIEGIGLGGEGSFDAFINQLYIFSITLAALLAVIKIIVAGVKYSLSEIVNTKGEAKGEIRGALFGLLIVMSAVLILEVINPQLVNINFNPEPVERVSYNPPVAIAGTEVSAEYTNVAMGIKEKGPCDSAGGIFVPEKETCFVKRGGSGAESGGSGGRVDYNAWNRMPGVDLISIDKSNSSVLFGKDGKIPPSAFVDGHYDEGGALDLCRPVGNGLDFYFRGVVTTKVKTCPGDNGGSFGATISDNGFGGPEMWISTKPGNRWTQVGNCNSRMGIVANIKWSQDSSSSKLSGCHLEDGQIYYVNFDEADCSLSTEEDRCYIAGSSAR